MEELGLQELSKVGFVLIAGGLGERLGYSGIKIDLPVTTIEEDYCYLKFYV
jgi:UDP-sugar pyrophosphorylase